MKDFKYTSFRLYSLTYLGVIILSIFKEGSLSDKVLKIPLEYHFLIFILLTILSVHTIVINRKEIIAQLYFMPFIKYRRKTWREIKHYANVKEMYIQWGTYNTNKSPTKTIWFIDYNDKVCFRVKKSSILKFNSSDFLYNVDRFEDKLLEEIEFDQPYFMSYGLTKVNYPVKKEGSEKQEKVQLKS